MLPREDRENARMAIAILPANTYTHAIDGFRPLRYNRSDVPACDSLTAASMRQAAQALAESLSSLARGAKRPAAMCPWGI